MAGATSSPETIVVFDVSGVFIHTTQADSEDILLAGKTQLVVKDQEANIEWNPLKDCDAVERPDPDWAVVNTGSDKRINKASELENVCTNQPSSQPRSMYSMTIPLSQVRTIRQSTPNLGWAYLVFKLTDNVEMPPLHFHEGGSEELISVLKRYVTITRSPTDKGTLNVQPHDPNALSTSFSELHILSEASANYATKFFKDPVTTTMGGFSKVTNFLRDNLLVNSTAMNRPVDDYADLFPDITTFKAEADFDLIAAKENKLAERPEVTRAAPVSEAEWHAHQDADGRVVNFQELNEKIFRGGIESSLRKDLWPFLLSYYSWKSSTKERIAAKKRKEDDYFGMKAQWKTITVEQEKRFSIFIDRKSLIDKDVIRTDRLDPFFAGENNVHLDQLFSILMTYCQLNFDLGYVQGMSDILAPILMVMEDEVDAFWCFVGFMDNQKLEQNFDLEQEGMKNQLIQLSNLLQVIEPEFYGFLQAKESSNLFFCFRWLLIRFKREFTFEDIMRLWEVMWTGLPCQNFHLLMCVAILDGEKVKMTRDDLDFNDILKHVNELSLKLNVEEILRKAESIFLQLKNSPELSEPLKEVIAAKELEVIEDISSEASESSIEIITEMDRLDKEYANYVS